MSSKKRVSYFYHGDVGHYYYGPGHPMKVCCDGRASSHEGKGVVDVPRALLWSTVCLMCHLVVPSLIAIVYRCTADPILLSTYLSLSPAFTFNPPIKPHRLKLTHHLVLGYGLYRKMEVYRPHIATTQELLKFHSEEYVNFLSRINPDMGRNLSTNLHKFNVGEFTDCPIFDGMMEFCKIYTGCSIDGAQKLNHKVTDIAVNWSGGLHHAKKSEASGFCYINVRFLPLSVSPSLLLPLSLPSSSHLFLHPSIPLFPACRCTHGDWRSSLWLNRLPTAPFSLSSSFPPIRTLSWPS